MSRAIPEDGDDTGVVVVPPGDAGDAFANGDDTGADVVPPGDDGDTFADGAVDDT